MATDDLDPLFGDAVETYFDVLHDLRKKPEGRDEIRRAYALHFANNEMGVNHDKVIATAADIEVYLISGKPLRAISLVPNESAVEITKWKLNEDTKRLEPAPL